MPTGPPRNPPPPCPRRSSISSVDPPGVHFIYVTSPWHYVNFLIMGNRGAACRLKSHVFPLRMSRFGDGLRLADYRLNQYRDTDGPSFFASDAYHRAPCVDRRCATWGGRRRLADR